VGEGDSEAEESEEGAAFISVPSSERQDVDASPGRGWRSNVDYLDDPQRRGACWFEDVCRDNRGCSHSRGHVCSLERRSDPHRSSALLILDD